MNAQPLYFVAAGGLANRLRALVGYAALAELHERPLHVVWANDGPCAADFDALFQRPSWEGFEVSEALPAGIARSSDIHRSGAPFMNIWDSFARELIPRERFAARAMARLLELRPIDALQARIAQFAADSDLATRTGFHIRATDNLATYAWWAQHDPHFDARKVSRFEGFEAEIHSRHIRGERIFLASDSADVTARLIGLTGGAAVTLKKQFDTAAHMRHVKALTAGEPITGSWRTTPVEDAVVELYLLARCKGIVGTYWSSFGWLAALIGCIPFQRMEGTSVVDDTNIVALLQMRGR